MEHSGNYKGMVWSLRQVPKNYGWGNRDRLVSIKGEDGRTVYSRRISYHIYTGSPNTPRQWGEQVIDWHLDRQAEETNHE